VLRNASPVGELFEGVTEPGPKSAAMIRPELRESHCALDLSTRFAPDRPCLGTIRPLPGTIPQHPEVADEGMVTGPLDGDRALASAPAAVSPFPVPDQVLVCLDRVGLGVADRRHGMVGQPQIEVGDEVVDTLSDFAARGTQGEPAELRFESMKEVEGFGGHLSSPMANGDRECTFNVAETCSVSLFFWYRTRT
jgi:hypothetical protein